MVSARVTLAAALLCALSLVAHAAPYESGNTPEKIVHGIVLDTLNVPNNGARTIFLIDAPAGGVRSNIDSLVNVWRAGGATPAIRRIQRLMIWNADDANADTQKFDLTIFRTGATTTNKGFAIWPFTALIDIPVEADSIRFTSHTTGQLVNGLHLGLCYW